MINLHQGSKQFIKTLSGENRLEEILSSLSNLSIPGTGCGSFVLCLGSTETSDIEGISAAGASARMRRLTPAIDAEALVSGRTVSSDSLPVSPRGVVSPVVITRACLRLAGIAPSVVDCGTFKSPQVPCSIKGLLPAKCVSTGRALPISAVRDLFSAGVKDGETSALNCRYLLVGECVPGGTTTALAVLTALEHDVHGSLSGSLPFSNHDQRRQLVAQGLQKSGVDPSSFKGDPLLAVAAVGDPMQPYVAGLTVGASKQIPVVLSGGSQMLAVYALIQSIGRARQLDLSDYRIAVITTKWVAFDKTADTRRLAEIVNAPTAASCPDFHSSRHAGLKAYEEGNVKEGVGAGGAMALAFASGKSDAEIMTAIDKMYDEMVSSPVSNPAKI